MSRLALVVGLGLAVVSACAPAVSTNEAREEPASGEPNEPPRDDAAADLEGRFELELGGESITAAELPVPEGPGHVERSGWSARGSFGYCRSRSAGCRECSFVSADGTTESIEAGPSCADGGSEAELEARLATELLLPGPTRWKAGAEVVLVVRTVELEAGPDERPRALLELGARRRDGGPPSWLLQVDPCEGCGIDQVCTASAHLDGVVLSPDAEQVVALVHLSGSDGRDELRLERIDARRVAEAAWSSVGSGALR